MLQPLYSLSDFDFHLPEELLAVYPSERRDESRLMVIHRESGKIEHRTFKEVHEYFSSGDALIVNNTKVVPARLFAFREGAVSERPVEVLLLGEEEKGKNLWCAMLGRAKRLKPGKRLFFKNGISAIYIGEKNSREKLLQFDDAMNPLDLRRELYDQGSIPLPPYIRREATEEDRERYQTIYASVEGAVAAPTAGLHFSPGLLEQLKKKGVHFPQVTLQVGLGTFNPVTSEEIASHNMHGEVFQLNEQTAEEINAVDLFKNKRCCVGTTSLRTLESCVGEGGKVHAQSGETKIFIYPPYKITSANALITNFHTPKSTLLMMISAFMGYDLMREAYDVAVKEKYRFFSYGDAMLIL